ncbi:MAG: tetratricopeptide repeat protein [Planctomycetaceae bacterium]|jgi:tetratricopeptide (TPR) repeat protein|nr:tetratricopeptide repeat protein [Planctomycetaceae bacterium]
MQHTINTENMINTFVGREEERRKWSELLADRNAEGQAVVVVGKYGMGKTRLLDQMVADAQENDLLQSVSLRYSVAPNESPGMVMKMMLEDAFQAARYSAGSLDYEGKRFRQWNLLYRKLGLFSGKKETDYQFFHALRYDHRKNIFEQFILRLHLLANMLPDNGRLLMVIDPEQDTPAVRVELWSQIVRELPPKVFFLFAQRFKDTLTVNEEFRSLQNVHFLPPLDAPDSPQGLTDLKDSDTFRLIETYQPFLKNHLNDHTPNHQELTDLFHCYRNHPYAVHASLDLLLCENIEHLNQLPREPMPQYIAPAQWKQIVEHRLGRDAVLLFEAYTVLEVPSLDEMVCWVADIAQKEFQTILAEPFFRSLIRDEPDGRIIYHHHLSSYIRSLLYTSDGSLTQEAVRLHQRAMIGYGELMRRTLKPDPLATVRLPEHSFAVGGAELFAETLGHCADAFLTLGFFQTFGAMIERALSLVRRQSVEESELFFQFGRLRYQQDDFESAVRYYEQSLQIARQITEPERIADALFALGKISYELEHDVEAEQNLREAIIYYESGPDQAGLVETLLCLGNVLWRQKKNQESQTAFDEASKVVADIKNYRLRVRSEAAVFTAQGRILDELGQTSSAAELYYKAIDLTQNIYDREAEAELHSRLGSLFERSGDLKTAEENLSKAMEIHREMTLVEHWAEDCFRLAQLARKQGNPKLVHERLQLARQLFQQLGNSLKIAEIDAET